MVNSVEGLRYGAHAAFVIATTTSWLALAIVSCAEVDPALGRPPRGGVQVGQGDLLDSGIPDGYVRTEDGALRTYEEDLFRKLESDFVQKCGGAEGKCHVTGSFGGAPVWLAPPDPYLSVRAHPGAIARDPHLSVLATKGEHSGPSVDFTDSDPKSFNQRFLQWLNAEAIALKAKPMPASDPAPVNPGPNTIDISKGGVGVAGSKITFDAAFSGTILSIANVKIVSPATTGLHIVQPLFVMVPPAPATEVLDPVDSFSNIDQKTNPGSTVSLGAGLAVFSGWKWDSAKKLKIQFPKLEPGTLGDGGALGGGCKSVATFQVNAAPVLTGQGGITPTCTSCHGNPGSSAGGAMNLVGLTGTNPDYTSACAQALTKVNLQNKAQSSLLIHPTTGAASHGGGAVNPAGTFTAAINAWLVNE